MFFVFFIRSTFFDVYKLSSSTMEPNFFTDNNVSVNKLSFNFLIPFTKKALLKLNAANYGDVVLYRDEETGTKYIGRIIGRPLDHIFINSDGWPIVNNNKLKIRYLETKKIDGLYKRTFEFNLTEGFSYKVIRQTDFPLNHMLNKSKTLKENQYFIMADNYDIAIDSRFRGPIEHKNLLGKITSKLKFFNH